MLQARVKLGENGRVLIPAEMRKVLGFEGNQHVVLEVRGGELRIMTPMQRLEEAQQEIARHFPPGTLMSEDLIRERHAEARKEAADER